MHCCQVSLRGGNSGRVWAVVCGEGRGWGGVGDAGVMERGGPKPLHCCQVGLNEQAEIAEVAGSLASCPSAPLCLPVSSPFPRFSPFPASSPACLSRPPALPVADYVSKDDPQTRIGAILGLGIAYAGRCARVAQQTGHTQQAKPGGGGGGGGDLAAGLAGSLLLLLPPPPPPPPPSCPAHIKDTTRWPLLLSCLPQGEGGCGPTAAAAAN